MSAKQLEAVAFCEPDDSTLPKKTTSGNRHNWPQWLLVLLPFAIIWAALISHLSVEWRVNPQYSHGWVVPFLCLSLLLGRFQKIGTRADSPCETNGRGKMILFFAALAFLWLPTRLLEEANPEWRMISWLLALETIGLTLVAIALRSGLPRVAQLAFPICFFLVAVPWPTFIESPLIQLLTNICASATVEVVGWLGIPALQHGNIIEVATGPVGIDEACSGIRSFQSTLMISLFLGELYGLSLWRRIILPPLGFLLALLFNVCRTSFLTWIAATKGVHAIGKYHDPAGVTIMIACLIALWLVALVIRHRSSERPSEGNPLRLPNAPSPELRRLALWLFVWVLVSAAAVEGWYRFHEWRVPRSPSWSVAWPRDNPTFTQNILDEKVKTILRYDDAVSASWQDPDGVGWYMIYLRWLPGRTAAHLATLHTPNVCLTASGHSVESVPNIVYLPVRGLKLPFREYIVNDTGVPAYVFYCLWEDRAQAQFFKTQLLTYNNRLAGVLTGQRNCGERSLEVMIQGVHSLKDAEASLVRKLNSLVQVGAPAGDRF